MTKREQLAAAQQALAGWRAGNITGRQLTPEQRAELDALQTPVNRLREEIGREAVAAVPPEALPEIVSESSATVFVRLPKWLLRDLLVLHEAGLPDEDHFAMAADNPDLARLFAAVLVLRGVK